MAVKVAVISYSATGSTYRLVQAVEQGATEAGADVRLRPMERHSPKTMAHLNRMKPQSRQRYSRVGAWLSGAQFIIGRKNA